MEEPTLSAIFGKRLRLIAAPKFCPMPHKPKDEGTLVVAEISEKVSELRVTSGISWPVAQERSFERALESVAPFGSSFGSSLWLKPLAQVVSKRKNQVVPR